MVNLFIKKLRNIIDLSLIVIKIASRFFKKNHKILVSLLKTHVLGWETCLYLCNFLTFFMKFVINADNYFFEQLLNKHN